MSRSVASPAAVCGASRVTFARRFTERVGEPPLWFLTGWRLALAADLLVGSDATLESVTAQVGYGNAFALSVAFKRTHGQSPTEYRRSAGARPAQQSVADRCRAARSWGRACRRRRRPCPCNRLLKSRAVQASVARTVGVAAAAFSSRQVLDAVSSDGSGKARGRVPVRAVSGTGARRRGRSARFRLPRRRARC